MLARLISEGTCSPTNAADAPNESIVCILAASKRRGAQGAGSRRRLARQRSGRQTEEGTMQCVMRVIEVQAPIGEQPQPWPATQGQALCGRIGLRRDRRWLTAMLC